MPAKMAANEIQTHARTNLRHTLDRGRGNSSTQDGFNYSTIAAPFWFKHVSI